MCSFKIFFTQYKCFTKLLFGKLRPQNIVSHISVIIYILLKNNMEVEDVYGKPVVQNLRMESIFNFTPVDTSILDLVSS